MHRLFLFVSALLLPVVSAAESAPRPSFGVVAAEMTTELRTRTGIEHGLLVRAVQPGSPAAAAGVEPGAVILSLDDTSIEDKSGMASFLDTRKAGDVVKARLLKRDGSPMMTEVTLAPRPEKAGSEPNSPDKAIGGDRVMCPLTIREDIREGIRAHRKIISQQLQALPDGMDASKLTDALHDIRNLARDANPYGDGWMVGRAGEASVQFKDAEGTLLIHGANNQLRVEVFDEKGGRIFTAPITTAEQCRALPPAILKRLKAL